MSITSVRTRTVGPSRWHRHTFDNPPMMTYTRTDPSDALGMPVRVLDDTDSSPVCECTAHGFPHSWLYCLRERV